MKINTLILITAIVMAALTADASNTKRSSSERSKFLSSKGYSKTPSGYQVHHKQPLFRGGADRASNMTLLSKSAHKAQTARDRHYYSKSHSATTKSHKSHSTTRSHRR